MCDMCRRVAAGAPSCTKKDQRPICLSIFLRLSCQGLILRPQLYKYVYRYSLQLPESSKLSFHRPGVTSGGGGVHGTVRWRVARGVGTACSRPSRFTTTPRAPHWPRRQPREGSSDGAVTTITLLLLRVPLRMLLLAVVAVVSRRVSWRLSCAKTTTADGCGASSYSSSTTRHRTTTPS
jgi:hypothetical protein